MVALALIAFRRRRRAPRTAKLPATPKTAAAVPAEVVPARPVIDLRPTVLICDDEPDIRRLYREAMEATGAIVVEAADGDECLRVAAAVLPDLVLLDLILPGGLSGLDVLTELRRLHPRTPVVVMSGTLSGTQLDRTRELGPRKASRSSA